MPPGVGPDPLCPGGVTPPPPPLGWTPTLYRTLPPALRGICPSGRSATTCLGENFGVGGGLCELSDATRQLMRASHGDNLCLGFPEIRPAPGLNHEEVWGRAGVRRWGLCGWGPAGHNSRPTLWRATGTHRAVRCGAGSCCGLNSVRLPFGAFHERMPPEQSSSQSQTAKDHHPPPNNK